MVPIAVLGFIQSEPPYVGCYNAFPEA